MNRCEAVRRFVTGLTLAVALAGGCGRAQTKGLAPPRGVEHIYICRADRSEHRLSPAQIRTAVDADEVRRDAAGESLFKCPQCGRFELRLVTRGMEGTP